MNIAAHPRYAELAAVLAPPPAVGFDDLAPADLARLSATERAELLALLEQRAAAQATAVRPDRRPIWHLIAESIIQAAQQAADPDGYLTAALAHEQSRCAHYAKLEAGWLIAEPASGGMAIWLKSYSERWAALHPRAVALAAADGCPPPGV